MNFENDIIETEASKPVKLLSKFAIQICPSLV